MLLWIACFIYSRLPFIRDNFLFYTVLFCEFLQRTKRMPLTSVVNAYLVFRVAKVSTVFAEKISE